MQNDVLPAIPSFQAVRLPVPLVQFDLGPTAGKLSSKTTTGPTTIRCGSFRKEVRGRAVELWRSLSQIIPITIVT
jgi:hypothetical protein